MSTTRKLAHELVLVTVARIDRLAPGHRILERDDPDADINRLRFRKRTSSRNHVCEHLDRCLRRWIVRVEVEPSGHHRTRMAENRGHCRDRNASRHQGGTKVMPESVQCA